MGSLRKAAWVTHMPARGQVTRFRRGEARFRAETRNRRKQQQQRERNRLDRCGGKAGGRERNTRTWQREEWGWGAWEPEP